MWVSYDAGKFWLDREFIDKSEPYPDTYHSALLLGETASKENWSELAVLRANQLYRQVLDQWKARHEITTSQLGEMISHVPRWDDLSSAQQIGVNYLVRSRSALLADEMGSGKTVQVCCALQVVERMCWFCNILIVCPNAVIDSWAEHIEQWTSLASIVLEGDADRRSHLLGIAQDCDKGFVLIVGWEMLRRHSRLSGYGNIRLSEDEKTPGGLNKIKWDVVVADEAHRAKGPKSKRTRALWAVSANAERKWALTGTPIANSPVDFWSLLRFMAPSDWRSRVRFTNTFCTTVHNPHSGADVATGFNPEARQRLSTLTDHLVLRRKTNEVIDRTITKVRSKRYVELSNAHRVAYNSMRDELIAKIEGGVLTAQAAIVASIRLCQLASSMLRMEGEEVVECVKPSPKLDELLELIEDLGDTQLVVIAPSRKLIELAYSFCPVSKTLYTGKVKTADRRQALADFRDGSAQLLFATSGTIGEGVDLAVARHLVMLQRPWSMVQSKQAEDRITRWTQKDNSVEIIDIITKDTIDQRILEALNTKQRFLTDFTKEELVDLL